jgi:hypothetical protein
MSDGQETVIQKSNRPEVDPSEAEQHYPLLEVGTQKKEYLQIQRNMILEWCGLDCFNPSTFPTKVKFVMKFM